MPLSLICACGARIELEDALAGQEVACPECQQPLKAPAAAQARAVRTSAFALTSLILALVGAFTLVGTLAAILCGLIAVVTILRDRERLAGLGYAVGGILLGFVFTALTAFALFGPESFAVAGWIRERNMAAAVEYPSALDADGKGWTITRPNEAWGVSRNTQLNDPVADIFLAKAPPDVVLVQVRRHGFVDVRPDSSDPKQRMAEYQAQLLAEYQGDLGDLFGGPPNSNSKNKDEGINRVTNGVIRRPAHPVPALAGYEGSETELDVQAGGQQWTLILRVYRNNRPGDKDAGRVYILRAYSPVRWAKENRAEFDKALDSFRLVK
jgi:hypothetical protein